MRRGQRTCLAVSGGADSVALARAMVAIAERENNKDQLLVVAVDHGLRGEESAQDAQFVWELGTRLGVKTRVVKLDRTQLDAQARRCGSLESAARDARYAALVAIAKANGARWLAVAHHRLDQLETILFRLFRGAGSDGLKGMAQFRPLDDSLVLARPMLDFGREEILEYLSALEQDYRIDSSNASPEFARNRIRNELIPALDSIFPNRWRGAILRLAELSERADEHFDREIAELERRLEEEKLKGRRLRAALSALNAENSDWVFEDDARRVELPLQPLRDVDDEILLRFFRKLWKERGWALGAMGLNEWRRLARAVRTAKGTETFPDAIMLTFAQDDSIRLEKRDPRNSAKCR